MITEQHKHHHIEGLDHFIHEINILWSDYLKFIQSRTKDKQFITQHHPLIQNVEISSIEQPDALSIELMRVKEELLITKNVDLSENLLGKNLLSSKKDLTLKVNGGYRAFCHYVPGLHETQMVDLYLDMHSTITMMYLLRRMWLDQEPKKISAFNQQFSHSAFKKFNLDTRNLTELFADNITTIAQVIRLFTGDTEHLKPNDALQVLNKLVHEKPKKIIHPQYPSLTLVALMGRLKFGVMALINRNNLIVANPLEKDLEQLIYEMMMIPEPATIKDWRGCPAIALIPHTFKVYFELLTALHPTKYTLDSSGKIHCLENKQRPSS